MADIFSSTVSSVPEAGQLMLSDRFLLSAGGCAVNTAACLRRIGTPARIVGKVGDDRLGDFVAADLERRSIDTSLLTRSRTHSTSATFVLNVKGDDRRYIHTMGANADLRTEDVESTLDGAAVLYVGGYLALPGFDAASLAKLFRTARERSIATVLDVMIPAGSRFPLDSIREVLLHTDVFLPNQDEARALTGEESHYLQAAILADLSSACTVVITRGRNGLLARRGPQTWEAGAYEMEAADESGAGDAFAAGVITGLMEHWPLETSLRFASALGASCTRGLGCTESVFERDEALRFMERVPLEIHTK